MASIDDTLKEAACPQPLSALSKSAAVALKAINQYVDADLVTDELKEARQNAERKQKVGGLGSASCPAHSEDFAEETTGSTKFQNSSLTCRWPPDNHARMLKNTNKVVFLSPDFSPAKAVMQTAGFCGQVTLKKVLEALDAKRIELLDIVLHLEKAAQSLDLVVQPRTA